MKYYSQINVDGVYHKIAGIAYDNSSSNYIAKVMMFSFYTKQQHDQCLASIQKGTSFMVGSARLYTKPKSYISYSKRCINDNLGDGYHAVFYSTDEDTVIVNKGEDENEVLYNHLLKYKSGLLPEWKDYFIQMLKDFGCINECTGFDNTLGKYLPKVYVLKDVDTELIRSIKAEGLKNGSITLPVPVNEPLDPNMEFIDIIEKLIIPHISSEKAHFNLGEEISPIIKSPIQKGNKIINLFKRQQIIGQGILNFIKDGNNMCLFNGGMRIGKTFTSIKVSHAVIEEVLKKKDAYIGVYCQGHIINTWKREFIACFKPLGITPTIRIINKISDLSKINKKPNGIEVLIFPKDRAKRSYTQAHAAMDKHKPTTDVDKFVIKVGDNKKNIIEIAKCNTLSKKKMKLATTRYTKLNDKNILLYKEMKTKKGLKYYRCVTNSKTLLKIFGNKNKWFNFTVSNLSTIHDAIADNINDIKKERINKSKTSYENYIICPKCGGKVFESDAHIYKENIREKFLKNLYVKDKSGKLTKRNKTGRLARCNNYVKADGTTISTHEMNELILQENFNVVNEYSKIVYEDHNGQPLTGDELQKAKRGLGNFKVNIRKCNHYMFGYEESRGGRTINTAKYLRKLFGDKFLDICIFDECHLYAGDTDQGFTMGQLVIASKINLLLSGTITGGKSSDLYNIFWRTMPNKMVQMGYDFKDKGLFVDHYGRRKKVTKEKTDYTSTKSGQTKMVSNGWTEIPGISPLLYNDFLTGIMVSRRVEDMGITLPPIKYIKEEVLMSDEQELNYNSLKYEILSFMKIHQKANLGGIYVKRLKSYLDWPDEQEIYATLFDENTETFKKLFVAKSKKIDTSKIHLPKEKKLMSTLMKEINQGRRVIVYTEFTGLGVSERLVQLLDKYFSVRALTSKTCKIEDREEKVAQWADEGVQVIVCNPKIVETGINLMSFPTMYFYDQTYDVRTLRQAEMRAYGPGQTKECRVYYAYYKNSIQEDAIKLIGSKKRASLALEGVFSNDMLSTMGDGGDSIESMLNKVLDGKIVLKESDLDAFQFETVNYDISDEIQEDSIKDDDNIIDVVPIPVTAVKEEQQETKVTSKKNTIFEVNNDFLNKFRNKAKETNNKSNVSNDFMSKINKLRGIDENKEVAATSSEQLSLFE